MGPRFTLPALKFAGMFTLNAGILSAGVREHVKHQQVYNNLPDDQRRDIYNHCVLQKLTTTGDAVAAIQERIMTINPDTHKDIQPKIAYADRPTLPKR